MLQHLNLYHLADWVLRPATRADCCSYVELISVEPERQMPRWFVSHAWQEAIVDFITCLDGHGAVRQLGTEAAYWVCAYANNQHELGNDLHSNPRETSFFRAMQLCSGVLLILDPLAMPFSRVWCCFELATAMTSHFERTSRLLLDIATVKDELPEVLTDGLTMHEEQQENAVCAGRGGKEKAKREERFPIELVKKALALDIAAASASRELDKIRILNSIAGLEEDRLDDPLPDPLPPARLQRYRAVDQALRCIFALSSVSQVISKDLKEMMPDICRALREESERRGVHISFANSLKLTDEDLSLLAQALPEGLTQLRFDLRSCHQLSNASLLELAKGLQRTKQLRSLFLDFYMCCSITDVGLLEIWRSIEDLQLLDLDINVRGLTKVTDRVVPAIISGLRSKALRKLHLNLTQTRQSDALGSELTMALAGLRQLDILKLYFTECPRVGDKTASSLGHSLQAMEMLSESIICFSNTTLTDDGMSHFARGVATLRRMGRMTLRFRRCQRITEQSMVMLGEACAALPLAKLQLDFSKCQALRREVAMRYSGPSEVVLDSLFHRKNGVAAATVEELVPNSDARTSSNDAEEEILGLFRRVGAETLSPEKLFSVLQKLHPELSKESFDELLSASDRGDSEG